MATQGYAVPAGPSITDSIWSLMDESYADFESTHPTDRFKQGRCQGLAEALAVLRNPYEPNVRAIKFEAQRRHQGDR